MKSLIERIAMRLSGMNYDDCTTAERQIADLLIEAGHLQKDDNGDLRDKDDQ